jgi:anthranilate/para-aminobenzoate synthase component I
VIDLIRAGDCYQVNLAHVLEGTFSGGARALFALLASRARPWHGYYMERDVDVMSGERTNARVTVRRAAVSVSPELFLRVEGATGIARTRPMKGTRAAADSVVEAADVESFALSSPKDHAELAMIVDMMRNDLGRSAVLGSVRVDAERRVERHGTGEGAVLQATGTVSCVLREGVAGLDAAATAFPPASITGAPKIRAMQIIGSLEPSARDAYCGCMGLAGDRGGVLLNVAIRTAMIDGVVDSAADACDAFVDARIRYAVGAGIVADSDDASEWAETLVKAGHVLAVARACGEGRGGSAGAEERSP